MENGWAMTWTWKYVSPAVLSLVNCYLGSAVDYIEVAVLHMTRRNYAISNEARDVLALPPRLTSHESMLNA
jgi:hypothetical protein